MRLTKKTKNGYFHKLFGDSPIYMKEQMISDLDNIIQKLGQLEDVEEELGIDLVTLFKALKNGIWTKGGYYSDQLEEKPTFVKRPEIGMRSYYDECDENYNTLVHDENVMCIYTYNYEITVKKTRLKDYGKTWALTKEELL